MIECIKDGIDELKLNELYAVYHIIEYEGKHIEKLCRTEDKAIDYTFDDPCYIGNYKIEKIKVD